MTDRARYIFLAGVAVFVALVIWAIVAAIFRTPPEGSVTDRDTGATLSIAPPEGVSEGAAGPEFVGVPIFGLPELLEKLKDDKGLYTDYIRISIQDFAKQRLDNRYSTLTIRPQETRVDGSVITSTLRLGQGDDMLPITITISNNRRSLILHVFDEQKRFGGDFVYIANLDAKSTLYTIDYDQNLKDKDSPITLNITASESYREAALESIRQAGFNPGDFLITFKDYENPFK